MKEFEVKTGNPVSLPNPGIGWTWLINLLIAVLGPIITILTAGLRRELQSFLTDWYKRAKESPNPWDDWVAELLLRILGFEIPS